MDLENIFRKPGREWTDEERARVTEWLNDQVQRDRLVPAVFGWVGDRKGDIVFAEEVIRNVLSDLGSRNYGTYDPSRSASTLPFWRWVCTAVRNEARRVAAKEARRKEKDIAHHAGQGQHGQNRDREGEESAIARYREAIDRYLPLLRPLHREAIELRLAGLSSKQASERSQKPCKAGAMRVRVLYARRELLRLMRDDQGGRA